MKQTYINLEIDSDEKLAKLLRSDIEIKEDFVDELIGISPFTKEELMNSKVNICVIPAITKYTLKLKSTKHIAFSTKEFKFESDIPVYVVNLYGNIIYISY